MAARGTAAEFEEALERARHGKLDLPTADTLLRGARRADRAAELYSAATEVRDRSLGRRLSLTAHIHMVTECAVEPPCKYCSLSSSLDSVNRERSRLTGRELVRRVVEATDRGVDGIVLVGGTHLEGSDDEIRTLLPKVRDATPVDLSLDIGPSLSETTLRWLKELGIERIYCSIETINERAFAAAKPGDRYTARLEFMDRIDRLGLSLGNIVMNGLGSPTDLLRSILHSRRYRHLTHLHISTFQPVPGTPWARRRPGSRATSLAALAIARLAFPNLELGLAEVGIEDPGGLRRGSNQLAAGGGNTLAGLLIYKHTQIDLLDSLRRRAIELGFTTS